MIEIVRHRKTGGLYEVLFRGAWLRTDEPLSDYAKVAVCQHRDIDTVSVWPHRAAEADDGRRRFLDSYAILHPMAQLQTDDPLAEGARVVVYRSMADRRVWVRPTSEMDDGRFEAAPVTHRAGTISLIEARITAAIRYYRDGAAVRTGVLPDQASHIAEVLQSLVSEPVAAHVAEHADAPAVAPTPIPTPEGERVSIPEGWVLVPREPTPEMHDAGWAASLGHDVTMSPDFPRINAKIYRAMLSAAPTPSLPRESQQ